MSAGEGFEILGGGEDKGGEPAPWHGIMGLAPRFTTTALAQPQGRGGLSPPTQTGQTPASK